ncbi:MAG: hypothetical protein MMC33_009395 [Icmadophila ericetorum]|nr:hypothetical protein [Icmadophila ericetorum]
MAPTTRGMAAKASCKPSETLKKAFKVKKQAPKSIKVPPREIPNKRVNVKKKEKTELAHQSKFFELPFELRLEIYKICLIKDATLKLKLNTPSKRRRSSFTDSDFPDEEDIIPKRAKFCVWFLSDLYPTFLSNTWSDTWYGNWAPNLALVNRQVYIETTPMLYGSNKFYFSKWRDIEYFRTITGERCISHMRDINVPFPIPRCLMDPFKIEMGLWERKGLRCLIRNSSLRILTFRISHDLSVEDYRHAWRTLLKEIPKDYRVYLQCDKNPDRSDGSIKLTKKVVDAILKRGWEFKGSYVIRDLDS